MPSIALIERLQDVDYKQLELVKLYKQLFHVDLKEAVEHIDFITIKDGYEIPVAEADIDTAAHFVYQARKFGLNCRLRSGFTM
ncbi:hypothetical protein GKZ68_11090 [Hymenobacter sp. BRD128]|uniref:hypothetical protein n=1 Tax=Hymenobacter sp. BRD128 TaxID=2675878 RepID=UPI0015659F29|nr:hypothetical protein [Hymenobacter sp. BRD128]QKG57127.1 hypothetical protein GKZ68_11090 [Hymenobacter sp. BRD128]